MEQKVVYFDEFKDFEGKIMNLVDFSSCFASLPTSFGPFSVAIWSWALSFKLETDEIGIVCVPKKNLLKKIDRKKK